MSASPRRTPARRPSAASLPVVRTNSSRLPPASPLPIADSVARVAAATGAERDGVTMEAQPASPSPQLLHWPSDQHVSAGNLQNHWSTLPSPAHPEHCLASATDKIAALYKHKLMRRFPLLWLIMLVQPCCKTMLKQINKTISLVAIS